MGRVILDRAATQSASNPFSTKFIRPGAIEFSVDRGEALPEIFARFERFGLRGQIVGPHGSGKSTLLWALRPLLEQISEVHWTQVSPRDGSGWPAIGEWFGTSLDRPRPKTSRDQRAVWVIDGFDSLSWVARRAIRRFSRRERVGLLITTHRDLKLPTLCRPFLTFPAFRNLVLQLLGDGAVEFDERDIQVAYDRHFPNAREALFALYDIFEKRRR